MTCFPTSAARWTSSLPGRVNRQLALARKRAGITLSVATPLEDRSETLVRGSGRSSARRPTSYARSARLTDSRRPARGVGSAPASRQANGTAPTVLALVRRVSRSCSSFVSASTRRRARALTRWVNKKIREPREGPAACPRVWAGTCRQEGTPDGRPRLQEGHPIVARALACGYQKKTPDLLSGISRLCPCQVQ